MRYNVIPAPVPSVGDLVLVTFWADTRPTFCTITGHGAKNGRPLLHLEQCTNKASRWAYLDQIQPLPRPYRR
jgi:hypothetical protein